jgi:hypothetical protein
MVTEVNCAEFTVMEFETPVIVAVPVSVEVIVFMDGAKRLTGKLPVPSRAHLSASRKLTQHPTASHEARILSTLL